jgi:hypothetical protein
MWTVSAVTGFVMLSTFKYTPDAEELATRRWPHAGGHDGSRAILSLAKDTQACCELTPALGRGLPGAGKNVAEG